MQTSLPAISSKRGSNHCLRNQGKRQQVIQCRAAITQQNAGKTTAGKQHEKEVVSVDSRTESFFRFCVDKLHVSSPKLKPAVFGGMRGMGAAADIKPAEVVISIPRTNTLCLTPREPPPPGISAAYWRTAPWYVRLGLMLLHEKRQGPCSRLAPYIEQLPQQYDAPVLWDDAQLQLLQYPHLIQSVREQRREWGALYSDLVAWGLQGGREGGGVSADEFLWALSAVRSRAFAGPYAAFSLADRIKLVGAVAGLALVNQGLGLVEGPVAAVAVGGALLLAAVYEAAASRTAHQYAMCPLVDLLNHSSLYEAGVRLDPLTDRYSMAAGRAYARGEQVTVSYGARPTNDTLLQFYGFTEPNNPHDVYTMTNMLKWMEGAPGEGAPEQARLDALNRAGLLPSLQLAHITRAGFPADTMQALRYVLAPAADAARGVGAFAAPRSPVLEARIAALLAHACACELKALGTSVKKDQRLLARMGGEDIAGPCVYGVTSPSSAPSSPSSSPPPPPPPSPSPPTAMSASRGGQEAMAVAFRVEKKKVLAACLAKLSDASVSN